MHDRRYKVVQLSDTDVNVNELVVRTADASTSPSIQAEDPHNIIQSSVQPKAGRFINDSL